MSKIFFSSLFALLIAGLVGCSPATKVHLETNPDQATAQLIRVSKGIQEPPLVQGVTPLSMSLDFGKPEDGISYIIRATKPQYKNADYAVTYDPQRTDQTVRLNLEREYVEIPLLSIDSRTTDQGVKLLTTIKYTRAYIETIERSPNVKAVTIVATNDEPSKQICQPSLSPVDETLVYPLLELEENTQHNKTHLVLAGETFESIATREHTDADLLRYVNSAVPNSQPTVGTLIKVTSLNAWSTIWKQSVGSASKTHVTTGKALDLFPSFTPDGKYLVFSSNRTSNNNTLWRIKVEGGGGITKLTNSTAEDFSSSVSHDGKTIGYASNPPNADQTQIWTIDSNGSLCTQLREGEQPQISPDGTKILFVRPDHDTHHRNIWVMNMDGSAETQLTQSDSVNPVDSADPRWSPDGKWIVYSSNAAFDLNKERNWDIWLMGADGSGKTQLTTNGSWDDAPCWNHDGKSIYFRSNRGGKWSIWRFQPILPERVGPPMRVSEND